MTDALVVGAGHNGLVAACYLARSGVNVTVLERRDVIGGATVTEEITWGFNVSTASYAFGLLRPDVHRELELERYGLRFHVKDPQMFVPLPDGRHFFVWNDSARTESEIERIHPPDVDGYRRFNAFWAQAAKVFQPLVDDPDPPTLDALRSQMRRDGQEELFRLAVEGSAAETVEGFFESDELRGAYASQGIIGTFAGPRDPGTAWVMTYHQLAGEITGSAGTWAFLEGGMGSLANALASSALADGVEIVTSAPVAAVVIENGRATGVVTEDGRRLDADIVLSNADPKTTFSTLVPSGSLPAAFVDRVQSWRTDGCVLKVNMAVNELPDFVALPSTTLGPQHLGTVEISPSIDYLQEAYQDAAVRGFSANPFMEVFVASAPDPSLAPEGRHVVSAFTQYVQSSDNWESVKQSALNAVMSKLGSYAPNLPDAVIAAQALGPPELEERFGLSGGDIFHGAILPEQSFGNRFGYRTPIEGLYLCGSGATPGGAVLGAPGRNAAKAALADLPD